LAAQVLDQTNGIAERFNQPVMVGTPRLAGLALGLIARDKMPSDGC